MTEEAIFHAASELALADRAAFLDQACGADAALRRRIDILLHAHANPGSFMGQPAVNRPTPDPAALEWHEALGSQIGPYKLMEQIGEGGMGLVFVAEQEQPIRRKVALKLIKPGMDTRHVIARFEAERQSLALMDHPNIAKIFDGGTTESSRHTPCAAAEAAPRPDPADGTRSVPATSGRPYFVMELVRGVPITDYCDENRLTPRARLELFGQVCAAIQHAHQKGIIHRDIKPSNVMIASQDGTPMAKVIDFGIAKAIGQRLVDKTVYTNFAQFVGTPLYMSPEQAGQSGLDIDTRTDVYALGVLLYELLTGTTPFEKERLKNATDDEIRRLIREEEPPKPSTRLSTLDARLDSTVSAHRQSSPQQLSLLMRGELDWIVMKALEKDRNRRYESASALAADVQRYLSDEPVEACPPSRRYRIGKFLRKHRRSLLTAVAFVGMAVTLAVVGVWVALDRASRLAGSATLVDEDIQEAVLWQRQERWDKALQALERAKGRVHEFGPSPLLDRVQQSAKDVALVARLQEARLRGLHTIVEHKRQADQLYGKAFTEHGLNIAAATETTADLIRSSAIREQLLTALEDWASIKDYLKDGRLFVRRHERDQFSAGAPLRALIRMADNDLWRQQVRRLAEANDRDGLLRLAQADDTLKQPPANLLFLYKECEYTPLLRGAFQRYPADFWINYTLGNDLALGAAAKKKDPAEGIGFIRAAIAAQPQYAEPYHDLGLFLWAAKILPDAVLAFQKAIELRPDYVQAHYDLGNVLRDLGRSSEAIAAYQQAIEPQPNNPLAYSEIGLLLQQHRKLPEAIAAYEKAIQFNPKDRETAGAHYNLGVLFLEQRQWPQAIASFRMAAQNEPKFADAHWNLGVALLHDGQFADGLKSLRTGRQLDSGNAKFAELLARAERFVELDPKLPSFIRREVAPADTAERLALANLCELPCRQFYATAARYYDEAFTAEPALANFLGAGRYRAACAAARAGCGQGRDVVTLEPKELTRLRTMALTWLRADLIAAWQSLVTKEPDKALEVQQTMQHWLQDPDLSGVRDEAALAKLTETERQAWRGLWDDVKELAKQTAAAK